MRLASIRKHDNEAIVVVRTEPKHIVELGQTMRKQDAHEAMSLGKLPDQFLEESYIKSIFSKTALVNGKVAACWGVCGQPMGVTGTPWLVTSDEVYKQSPLAYALLYRQEVKKMTEIFPILENIVEASYTESVRLLKIIGFQVSDPEPIGVNGELFCKFRWTA